jgi:hypothetical protein
MIGMKESARLLTIVLVVTLCGGSWIYAQQAGNDTKAANTQKQCASKQSICVNDTCQNPCVGKAESEDCGREKSGKTDCLKKKCGQSDCGKNEECSMKSDSTKHTCMAMKNSSERSEIGCCKEMKKEKCGEGTMKRKCDHHPAKTKTQKSPEPKKADT